QRGNQIRIIGLNSKVIDRHWQFQVTVQIDHLPVLQDLIAGVGELFASAFPRGSSLLSLPPSHRAWDECAAEVPNLLLTHTASRTIAALPELSADAAYLDDGALCRAALVLGVLAHAFVRDTERRQNHRGGFAEPQSDAAVERV